MRAPDLEAIASHFAALSVINTRNDWLRSLSVSIENLPYDEDIRWSRLLEMVRAAGPPEPPLDYDMRMARDLDTYHTANHPKKRMTAFTLLGVIKHVMMTPDEGLYEP